jgi:hypothetical protein
MRRITNVDAPRTQPGADLQKAIDGFEPCPRQQTYLKASVSGAAPSWRRPEGGHVGRIRALLDVKPGMRLDEVVRRTSDLPFDGTDCSLPINWAIQHAKSFGGFVEYANSET